MTNDITPADILALVDALEPVELLAIELQARVETPTEEQLITATNQLVAYTKECDRLVTKLRSLASMPVEDPRMVMEFAL